MNEIETLLTKIRPNPSERLNQKMQNAPWKQNQTTPYRDMAVAGIVIIAFLLTLLFTPLGTLAQDLIGRFFIPLETNTQTDVITRDLQPTPSSEAVIWQPLSLEEAQAQVSFTIAQPSSLPAGYVFDGADVYRSGNTTHVMTTYSVAEGDKLGRNLVLIQYPAEQITPRDVGANAVVEPVDINGASGEYTRGMWASIDQTVLGTEGTIETREIEREWHNNLGFHYIHWANNGMVYEVMFQETHYAMAPNVYVDGKPDAKGYLTKDDLIAFARSIE